MSAGHNGTYGFHAPGDGLVWQVASGMPEETHALVEGLLGSWWLVEDRHSAQHMRQNGFSASIVTRQALLWHVLLIFYTQRIWGHLF